MDMLYAAFDPVPFPKGSAVRIEATVRALAAAGLKVDLLTVEPSHRPEGFAERIECEGVEHRPVPIVGEHFLDRALAFREATRTRLRERDYQVVMFRSPWEGLAAVEKGLPCVYEAHGFPSVELPYHYPGVLSRPQLLDRLAAQEVACLRRSQLFVTPSATGRTYLISRGAPPRQIEVIPNSILPENFPEPPAPPPGPPWRLAYLGTLAPWQGLTTLLEALARLKGRLPVQLVLAGTRKGRWIRQARATAQRLRVRSMLDFAGPLSRSNVLELLWSCHFCLAPLPDDPRNSLQGCCPIKLLEYMACGRPLLSTQLRPVRELVTHAETGWLVRPNSCQALAEGIQQLAADPSLALELAQKARLEVLDRFPRQRFIAQIAHLVSRLQTG
ncbi:MAG: glycosyltransferase family 4 protein [Vulcanimicrobiota bacterium]